MQTSFSRRRFLETTAVAGAGALINHRTHAAPATAPNSPPSSVSSWPVFDTTEEQALLDVVRSGKWGRNAGKRVAEFEAAFARATGAKYCLTTSSGTTALLTAFGAIGIGPGDEVVLPPYTWVACFNVITCNYALPVFVDTNPNTFQIDAGKISAALTDSTKAILPVHIGGSAADMDEIMRVAQTRNIAVVEDACQAHLSEWRGRVVGNSGLAGCFSFQASKNLTAGEGGAIITNDEGFANKCYAFHNQGGGRPAVRSGRGANFRLTEFQGGVLLAQLARLEQQTRTRDKNAAYLRTLLGEIPGITPARLHAGCTRSSYHLFMLRYDSRQFSGLPRTKFLQALAKEGVAGASGYEPLNTSDQAKALVTNPHYLRLYGRGTMAKWQERNQCPVNDRLCGEAVWFSQRLLLAPRSAMDRIADTVRRVQQNSAGLAKL